MKTASPISTATEYLQRHASLRLEDHEAPFASYLALLRGFRQVDGSTRMLEIGTGTGWFPLMCASHGLSCEGLELTPEFIEHARQWGERLGLNLDIRQGNVETTDLGDDVYDVVFAQSVFEHVRDWKPALQRVFRALRPGGILVFSSTNKFSPRSGEYPALFYGWLPNALRYRLRVARQGQRVMELGIDYNQFTYPGLRRAFRAAGFSRICDWLELSRLKPPLSPGKRAILRIVDSNPLTRAVARTFYSATIFVCVK